MDEDPDYQISVTHVGGDLAGCEVPVQEAVEQALRHHQTARARINVALVDDEHIANLNERFLKHSGPTDVLAFDLADERLLLDDQPSPGKEELPQHQSYVEGDIVVSADTAKREAQSRNHDVEAELALYVIHGTLHLLGYADDSESRAANMHEVEDEILTSLGLGGVYRTKPL